MNYTYRNEYSVGKVEITTTTGGKTYALTAPNPREDLQQAEARAVMNSLIASDIFLTSSGALIGIRKKFSDTSFI